MSQIPDIAPHPARPATPGTLAAFGDGDLADELRGQRFARDRADARIAAIGAELERRNLVTARGKTSVATFHTDPLGRVDLKRLRAEQPEICRAYALPGSSSWWSVRTLKPEERR